MNNCIIHIIDSLARGGAEILLKNTVNSLPGYKHTIVHLYPNTELAKEFEVEVEFIFINHKGWPGLLSSVLKLKRIISAQKPLLVHSHLLTSTLCARLATPRKVPLVTTLHSTYSVDAFEKNRFSEWIERLTIKNRHVLIGVSKYLLDDYLRFIPFKGKSFVLYNFLPEASFYHRTGRQDNVLKCVAIGNLKEAKNYPFLLDIFSALKDTGISLDIYGEGLLRKHLQERINKEGLPVRLCGQTNATSDVLARYDLFIQASSHEGFGISVIEAMVAGLPVFLSDIPVFREITNGNAYFFPLNEPVLAAQIILKGIKDKNKTQKNCMMGLSFVQKEYSQQIYRERLLKIYSEVAGVDM